MYYNYRIGGGAFHLLRVATGLLRPSLLAYAICLGLVLSMSIQAAISFTDSPRQGTVFAQDSNINAPVVYEFEEQQGAQFVFDKSGLQSALDDWVSSAGGASSVVVSDVSGDVLAKHNANQKFFAASIYKVYVAYAGYQMVDAGEYNLQDKFWRDYSVEKCLEIMISESHSPCAEAMMADIGRDVIQSRLNSYGLENTQMSNITTTSADIAVILSRLWQGKDLSDKSRSLMLESMLGQIYRRALPAGFEGAKVYDKVGFRDHDEYHDVAIVEQPDGRAVIVSAMTNKVGEYNLLRLAQSLNQKL